MMSNDIENKKFVAEVLAEEGNLDANPIIDDKQLKQKYKDSFLSHNQDCKVDYFKILGLTKDSSLSDVSHVRNAHYKLALKFHPDKHGTKESNDVMASVNNAVDVVKALIKNIDHYRCNTNYSDDFLREVSSEYGSFQNYFLTGAADQEASAFAEPTVQLEYTGDQANFLDVVTVGY